MSSIVVISRLSPTSDSNHSGLIWGHTHGKIIDIGFSETPDDILFGRPPRPETTPYDNAGWMEDKFLYVARSESGSSLGTLKVAETLVEDAYMRGPIDFTGIRVYVYLRADAHNAYVNYIGKFPAGTPKPDRWDGRIRLRIPSRPFSFPMPRGSSKPWDTGTRATGQLRPIRQFNFDQLEVEALGREMAGDAPPTESGTEVQGKLLLRAPRQGLFRLPSAVLSSTRR